MVTSSALVQSYVFAVHTAPLTSPCSTIKRSKNGRPVAVPASITPLHPQAVQRHGTSRTSTLERHFVVLRFRKLASFVSLPTVNVSGYVQPRTKDEQVLEAVVPPAEIEVMHLIVLR